MSLKPITKIAKPQTVRIADVLLIGPLMVWGGIQVREKNPLGGGMLAFLGITTVFYNLENYLAERRRDGSDK